MSVQSVPVEWRGMVDYFRISDSAWNINRMYFDTGIPSRNDIDFEMMLAFDGNISVGNQAIIDAGQPSDDWAVVLNRSTINNWTTGVAVSGIPIQRNVPFTVALIGDSFYFNGELKKEGERLASHNPRNIRLLSYQRSDGSRLTVPVCFYYTKIWEGGTLIRHYVFHMDELDRRCLYDRVNGSILYGTRY